MDRSEKIDFSPGSLVRLQIANEFKKSIWEPFKNCFSKTPQKKMRNSSKKKFYDHLDKVNKIAYFISWFLDKYILNYLTVIERDYQINNEKNSKVGVSTTTTFSN